MTYTKRNSPPRLTTAQRDAITDPRPGEFIYVTNATAGQELQFWNGSEWRYLGGQLPT